MIPYIQPIFIPDNKHFNINAESIKSLAAYLKKCPYDVKIIFGGWSASLDNWNKIKKLINENFKDITPIKKYDKNYGKAYIVNDLFNQIKDDKFGYFLTADSDMQFSKDVPYVFERLLEMAAKSTKQRPIPVGLIALNQLEHNCHLKHIYKHKYTYTNSYGDDELYVHGDGPGGMGGGCFFISKAAWIKVGGYRVMGVYAGDDAYMLLDLAKNGYSVQMSDSIGLIHPRNNDHEYAKWKGKICQRDSGPVKGKEAYNKIVKETENFWHAKNNK